MSSFSDSIKLYAEKTGMKLEKATTGVIASLWKGVTMDTPVDTGRLRGNWQASVGTPIYTEIDREDKNGSATVADAISKIVPFGVNYLSNNLPYAKIREEKGGRNGVNAGFVAKNMARIERNIKEAFA